MANKFTDTIKKNPNAIDPQGQNFGKEEKAQWDKGQDKRVQDVDNQLKASNEKYKAQEQSKLKEQVSKMKGNQKAPDNSKQKAPTHDR